MKTRVALRRIRRKRDEIANEPSRFDQYRDEYGIIFQEVSVIAGPEAMQTLTEWTTAQTVQNRCLPDPASLRDRALELCSDRGHEIPETSALQGPG